MGNSHPPIGENPTALSKLIDSQAEYEVYQSPSGEEFQRSIVLHDGSEDFQQLYRFRVENRHTDLVDLLFAGPAQGFMGCTERGRFEVITERVPYRLQALSGLHSRNALAILRTALRGFRDVYRRHGAVGVAAGMIGVNVRSRVKVWLNRNFAVNSPEPVPSSSLGLSLQDQEREMVLGIFDLVDAKTDHDALWVDLVRLKQARNPRTFDEGLNLVDYFSGANRINIPDSVSNLFNKRAYHPQEGVVHVESHERIERANGGVPQGVAVMRRPFEEISSKVGRVQSFPVYQPIPLSHTVPIPIISPVVQPPVTVSSSGNRPMIRFNIKTTQNQQIPQYTPTPTHSPTYTPTPVTFQQQNAFPQHPSQAISIIKPQEVVVEAEAVKLCTENEDLAPTFKELPIPEEPVAVAIPQSQIPQAREPSPDVQIRILESYQPETEQQQIHLPPEPPLQDRSHLSLDGYEVNIHEVSSQESLHEQLTSLVAEQNKENLPQQRVVLVAEENVQSEQSKGATSLKNLESLKTVIKASLVDTREIKHSSAQEIVDQEELRSGRSLRSQRATSISYREMRRLLLEELSN